MRKIEMVDLKSQYLRLKPQMDAVMQAVIDSTAFVKGPKVAEFQKNLEEYLSFGKIAACGGSWMVKADLVDNKEFDKIAEMTKEAVDLVKKIRG